MVTGPPAADLPERWAVAGKALRLKEVDGHRDVGVEPVDLETAVAHSANTEEKAPTPPGYGIRFEQDPAEQAGVLGGLSIRREGSPLHGDASAEHDVDFQAVAAGSGVAGDEAVESTRAGHPAGPGLIICWPSSRST